MQRHGDHVIVESAEDLIDYCQEKNIRIGTGPAGFTVASREIDVDGDLYHVIRLAKGPAKTMPYKMSAHKIYLKRDVLEKINEEFTSFEGPSPAQTRRSADLRSLTDGPMERTFVYLDISDFSTHTQDEQANIIRSLVMLVENDNNWNCKSVWRDLRSHMEAQLCIGDGYIFVFVNPGSAALFAAHLANLIERVTAMKGFDTGFHFRASVHSGEVNRFYDPGRRDWNYVGEGINGGNRVLNAMGKDRDDTVYVSEKLRYDVLNASSSALTQSLIDSFTNMGRVKDKHKKPWRVFMMDHMKVFKGVFYDFLRPE